MTAVSSGFVCTVSNVGGWPPMNRASGMTSGPSSKAGSSGIDGCGSTISCLARRHDGNRGLRRFRHRQLRRSLKAEHRLRIAVAQVIGNLARLQQHVQRHDRRARLEDAEIDRRKIRQVRAQQRDMIAAPDAGGRQRVGNLVGPCVELRIGEALVAADERLGVGSSPRVLLEHRREVQHEDSRMLTQLVDGAVDGGDELFGVNGTSNRCRRLSST